MEPHSSERNGPNSTAKEVNIDLIERPLQMSVTEKVIFCIDSVVLFYGDDNSFITEIHTLLQSYIVMKDAISIKPVEFQCMILHRNKKATLKNMKSIDYSCSVYEALRLLLESNLTDIEEVEPFDFNVLFETLAEAIELPDPVQYDEFLPPPFVYHVIFLFGRNMHIPIVSETNAFHFLMQSPFFSFDTIYIYDNNKPNNKCSQITQAIKGLQQMSSDYFFSFPYNEIDKHFNAFTKCLGHPLIRFPQFRAKYDIQELDNAGNQD